MQLQRRDAVGPPKVVRELGMTQPFTCAAPWSCWSLGEFVCKVLRGQVMAASLNWISHHPHGAGFYDLLPLFKTDPKPIHHLPHAHS